MYKNYNVMPLITQHSCVQQLQSVDLIRQKMELEHDRGDILVHSAHYSEEYDDDEQIIYDLPKNKNPLMYRFEAESSSDSDDVSDNAVGASSDSDSVSDSAAGACAAAQSPQIEDRAPQSDVDSEEQTKPKKSDMIKVDADENDVSCTFVEDYTDMTTGDTETIFELRIRNLNMKVDVVDVEVIDAMQQFVDNARKKLKQGEHPICKGASIAYAQQQIYTNVFYTLPQNSHLDIRVHNDGQIQYMRINTRNKENIIMRKNDHLLSTWNGKIQQIDYQCLYDSLDALFAIIYMNADIQCTLLSDQMAKKIIGDMFHSMHFPANTHRAISLHYANIDSKGKAAYPNMPIAEIVCVDDTHNAAMTNLSHMSVLLDLHKHFVDTEATFAYQLIGAMMQDITDLWSLRCSLMPQQQECDLFAYGIVPVVQDALPQDYAQHENTLIVPEYMKTRINHSQNMTDYAQLIITLGTNEMCTWGCAAVFLHAAIRESFKNIEQYHKVLNSLELLMSKIDTRFECFLNATSMKVCKKLREYEIHQLSGQAMPLFCMVLCNLMSLSQAMHNIMVENTDTRILNKSKLIRVHRDSWQKLLGQ